VGDLYKWKVFEIPMTKEEILKKAIRKAAGNMPMPRFIERDIETSLREDTYFAIIFSHDFAKAFWGEKKCYWLKGGYDNYDKEIEDLESGDSQDWYQVLPKWQYHLQQMVISEDPVKYLEKFL